jgi:hypothetical protein
LVGPATNLVVTSGAVVVSGLLELGLSVFIAFSFFMAGKWRLTFVGSVKGSPELGQ